MRRAKADDYKRRLVENVRVWRVRVNSVVYDRVPSLGSGTIEFNSPVSVICGPNGVGKSTLLKLIWAALDPSRALSSAGNVAKLSSGAGTVTFSEQEVVAARTLDLPAAANLEPASGTLIVEHVDTASDVGRMQAIYAPITDLEAFINGAGSVDLGPKEITELNFLTRRRYGAVRLFEIELADETIPFFNVSLDEQNYDSRTMGAGEFAAFLLWWHFRRAEIGTVLLLEEPECFLSPRAKSSFIEVLLKYAFERQLCIIMTSHSSEIIQPLPSTAVRFFRRDRDGVALAGEKPAPVLLKTIGISPLLDILVFVEDRAAKVFAKLWIGHYHPALAQRLDINIKGSDGAIINAIRHVNAKYNCIQILGLFDGDAKGRVPIALQDRTAFLPGDQAIEIMFRDFVSANMSSFRDDHGWPNLSDILFALEGEDHHDWFEDLARNLSIDINMLFISIFKAWISVPDNEALASSAYKELARILGENLEEKAIATERIVEASEAESQNGHEPHPPRV